MRRSLAPCLLVTLLAAGTAQAAPYQRPGSTERVSVGAWGQEPQLAVGFSPPRMSADGRLVVFTNAGGDLVPGDENGVLDVFLRDREAGTTERLSTAPGGLDADGASGSGSLSADGRMAAFSSAATNLVPDDTNGKTDVFVLDRATREIRCATCEGNGSSTNPLISGDGRKVAFTSLATNLAPGDTNGAADTFVHDLEAGTTTLVSATPAGGPGNGASPPPSLSGTATPAISHDGRYVAFNSAATDLVSGDTNARTDTFLRDLDRGVTELVSVSSDERQTREAVYSAPSISADGRLVTFDTWSWQLVPLDTNGDLGPVFINFALGFDVYVRDTVAGTTTEVTVTSAGAESNRDSGYPQLSPDGRYVTFSSAADNLAAGDTNGQTDVFVHDMTTGTTERVSLSGAGDEADGGSFLSTISSGGRVVAFQSAASNLAGEDRNEVNDVYVRDRGGELGVLDAAATRTEAGVRVTGRATFSGSALSAGDDPAGDATGGVPGADLVGATVVYRPERDDLLARLHLNDLPELRDPRVEAGTAGTMGLVYGLELQVGEARFAARGSQRGAAVSPRVRDSETGETRTPSSEETWHFELVRCLATCRLAEPVGTIAGGYGTTGDEVRFAIPISALGISSGTTLSSMAVFTAPGEAAAEPGQWLDSIAFGPSVLPPPTVRVSLGENEMEVPVIAGSFEALLPDQAGDITAQACLGPCGAATAVAFAG